MPSSKSEVRMMIPDLAGKVVLITGASTGIGAALALAFSQQGCKIGLHYHASVQEAEALRDKIEKKKGEVYLVRGDIADPLEVERVVGQTASHFGRLDGLINNAGGMLGRVPTVSVTDEHYDAVMDLNARSVLVATRAAYPYLRKRGGFIIHTSSIAARTGGSGGAVLYAASKGFVSALTHGQAKELIADKIRVNAVAPGVISTPFHQRYSTPAQLAAMQSSIPQGRLGTAEDCVGAYLFLASEMLSGYIVGQVIEVNGGQLTP
ncbi:MAG: SDR family oxidoreductase [Hyphomicrobiales bacterium]|nr:SDR family oxidoreductase [Hyphomicrobiales bacterium]MDE2115232.1 SDR family oxidoreductase [Hyphomicrobiales bacterium]